MTDNSRERVLFIGGSSGIGLASAKLAVEKNYSVIIASRSQEKLKKAQQQLNSKNVQISVVNTLDDYSVKQLFASIGMIHHLVISASEVQYGNIQNSSIEAVKASFDSKFFGPFRVVKEALHHIEHQGSITFFSGTAGTKPEKGTEILSAVNLAVDGFARALAVSLAPIRVNCVSPGIIDTPVYAGIDDATRALFNQFLDNLLVKRMGSSEEVAQAVLYLMNNQYVTGTVLHVDGGHVVS